MKQFLEDRIVWFIAIIFVGSTFLHGPVESWYMSGVPHLRVGSGALTRPLTLSGDCPHFLVIVNSLIEDGNFDLANNHQQARSGDWDAGTRFRGIRLGEHVDIDREGRHLSGHPPFMPLLVAPLAWPLRGTQWVESLCIWLTVLISLVGLWHFSRRSGHGAYWTAVLAFATPWWCYSRDFWTEPWLGAIWIGLLFSESLVLLALLGFWGTLIKYPFVVVPVMMGLVDLWQGRRRRGAVILASGLVGILVAFGVVQYLFRAVDHFDFFHLGWHIKRKVPAAVSIISRYRLAPWGVIGLLFEPHKGLLAFFPFLALGFWQFRKGGRTYLPALCFFAVHAFYVGWTAGSGFSARYLTPMLPVFVIAVAEAKPRKWLLNVTVAYSLIWGAVAGIYPALAYNRTVWGMVQHVLKHASRFWG